MYNKKDKVIMESRVLLEKQGEFISELLGDCSVLSEWIELLRQGYNNKEFLEVVDKYLAAKVKADEDKNITLH